MQIRSLTIIGTGNVATHLGKAFSDAGMQINAIVARSKEKAEELAQQLKNTHALDFSDVLPVSDAYLLAVKDDAILEVAKKISTKEKLLIHCSGAAAGKMVDINGNSYGVLWPMQTLTKNNLIDLKQTLVAVSGNTPEVEAAIGELAEKISDRVIKVSESQRAMLHLAAVWINNYINHMFVIAEELMLENNLDFNLFIPMIDEHISKLKTMSASQLQTGPASRGDMVTLNKHRSMLKGHPDILQLYDAIAQSILNRSIKK